MGTLGRSEILILVAMGLAVFMDGVDGSIVNVALPTIADYFHIDASTASWVTILYFMMMAGLLLTFGRMADVGHLKRVFIMGFALFTAGSLACGITPSFEVLLVSRTVQGIGAAMMGATAPMMIVKFLPPRNLALGMGVLTLACSGGFAVGPAIGGIITDVLGWHWIFLINVPIGVFAILFSLKVIPDDVHTGKRANYDLRGTSLLFVSIVSGVYALEGMSHPESRMECIVTGSVCILFLVLFVMNSRRTEKPLLNLEMFRNWKVISLLTSFTLVNLTYMGILYLIPFYMTLVLGLSSSMCGLLLFMPPLITLVLALPVGRLCDLYGRRPFAIGSAISMLAYSIILALMRPDMGYVILLPIGVLMGLNWGLFGASATSRVIEILPDEDKAMGSSMMNFFIYMGSTVGTALFAAFFSIVGETGGTPIDMLDVDVFMAGFTPAMVLACVLSAICVVTAWIVKERRQPGY